jgi:hypothetical protein
MKALIERLASETDTQFVAFRFVCQVIHPNGADEEVWMQAHAAVNLVPYLHHGGRLSGVMTIGQHEYFVFSGYGCTPSVHSASARCLGSLE